LNEENTLEEEIEEDDSEDEIDIGDTFRLGKAYKFVEKLYTDIGDVPDVNGGGKKRRRKTRKNRKK
jgi:hypothetical protein